MGGARLAGAGGAPWPVRGAARSLLTCMAGALSRPACAAAHALEAYMQRACSAAGALMHAHALVCGSSDESGIGAALQLRVMQ
jgi:hypothetical protein